jgi:U3 small nucleolar ribonucleoprotein component
MPFFQEKKLSAHERQQEKTKRRIEQLEKANLESKDWTMQGEVLAVIFFIIRVFLVYLGS